MENLRFNLRKVTELAVVLLREAGGSMEYIKLIKLMYLVDRAALNERGWPISTDVYVSMAHGPVLSRTYDLIREPPWPERESVWQSHIRRKGTYHIELTQAPLTIEAMSENEIGIAQEVVAHFGSWPWQDLVQYLTIEAMSENEIGIAQEVVAHFGSWPWQDLVQYTHDHLPEWQDPDAKPVGPASRPLPLEDILTALGKEDDYIQEVVARVKVSNQLDEWLS